MRRSSFLVLLIVLASLLSACAPVTPEIIEIEKEVPIEKKVVETVIVEKVVEKVVAPTQVPPAIATGDTLLLGATGGYGAAMHAICPAYCDGGWCNSVVLLTTPGLTILDDTMQPTPSLATKWEGNDNADTWTFYLDPNTTWSDGQPVTADDVAFTYSLFCNPDSGSHQCGSLGGEFKGLNAFKEKTADTIEGIQVVDQHTIKFVFEQPNAVFPNKATAGIMPKHVLEDVEPTDMVSDPYCADGPSVVSGPYKYMRRQASQIFELEARTDYWGEPVAFDKVIVKSLNDDVAATQLESGEVEVMRVPATEFERLDAMPHLRGYVSPEGLTWCYFFNENKPALRDTRIRQALSYAIDRQALADVVWPGLGRPVCSIAGPEWAIDSELVGIDNCVYDPEKAKELLEEAGWDFNETITIMVGPWTDNIRPMEAIQAQWTNIGLRVEVVVIAIAAWNEKFDSDQWDITINAFPTNDPSSWYPSLITCEGSGSKQAGYCNPEIDQLLAEGVSTADQAKRSEIYRKVQSIWADDMHFGFLYATGTPWVINEGLKGVKLPYDWSLYRVEFLRVDALGRRSGN